MTNDDLPVFHVLGPVRLTRAGEEFTLGPDKCRIILAALLLAEGHSLPVYELIRAAWGEEPPRSVKEDIYHHIRSLRSVLRQVGLDGALQHVKGGYRLDVAPDLVDVHRFRRLSDEAKQLLGVDEAEAVRLFRAALALWDGDPMADLGEGRAVEDWRVVIRATYRSTLVAYGDAELHLGQLDRLIETVGPAFARLPSDEMLAGYLMLAHYRLDNQPMALGVYQRLREALVDWGVDAGPEIRELYERILHHDQSLRDGDGSSDGPGPPWARKGGKRRDGTGKASRDGAGPEVQHNYYGPTATGRGSFVAHEIKIDTLHNG